MVDTRNHNQVYITEIATNEIESFKINFFIHNYFSFNKTKELIIYHSKKNK